MIRVGRLSLDLIEEPVGAEKRRPHGREGGEYPGQQIAGQHCRAGGDRKNEKDEDKIKAALTKTEPEKSAVKDKTFGDLLKDGKLPASK